MYMFSIVVYIYLRESFVYFDLGNDLVKERADGDREH